MSVESRLLQTLLPWRQAPAWRVAFSGGLDSSVLLYALVRLASQHRLPPITAIHIHHGLQPAADAWPEHCQQFCQRLGVPLQVIYVDVPEEASLEQAARNARYAALSACLGKGELLLTAQHRDDQAETLLFRLVRGGGVRGLAAMPAMRSLGAGRLFRPLLETERAELESYADQHQLVWVEDPTNNSSEYARNYLRHEVMPRLNRRWPQATQSMARAAQHLAEAQHLLDDLAEMDKMAANTPHPWSWLPLPSLDLRVLGSLSEARQRNLLRHWLSPMTLLPETDHWAGWRALRDAKPDAVPHWCLQGGEMHRSGGRVWWLYGKWLEPVSGSLSWPVPRLELALPANGYVRCEGQIQGALEVRYRVGGEMLSLPARGRRELKRLLNESGMPRFVRSRLPLLYCDGELIAVANMPQWNLAQVSLVWKPPA